MALRLYYCDHYEFPLPAGHKFPQRKYRLLREALASDGRFELIAAPLADPGMIALAHDPAYVSSFVSGALGPAAMRRIGFPWSESLVQRTLASVGGTVQAAADALQYGFGGNLAGGTHHAFPAGGSGFCVFNDAAVAIHVLRVERAARRAAVIDLDVHQGDGTAAFFSGDSGVLTVSLHAENNFPFRKQPSKIDVPLPDGTDDAAYLAALESVLPRVFEFSPEVIFCQTGVDTLAGDALGRLALTHAGLLHRDRMVLGACARQGVPVVVTLGGGYAEPIERTVEAHANTFRIAAETFREVTSSAAARKLPNLFGTRP